MDFFATFSHNQKLFLLPRLKRGCSGTRLNVTDGGQSSTLKSSLLANLESKKGAGSPGGVDRMSSYEDTLGSTFVPTPSPYRADSASCLSNYVPPISWNQRNLSVFCKTSSQ